MKYRREIDGLRGVAVIPVILFHAGFSLFSGGFVGVDVFFVISGYLITSIIINEQANGTFTLLKFYERRARRILPALFFVMLCTIPFAWLWMMRSEFIDFAQSIVAVSVFASNILFWRESGYFAAAADDKPLLHTWSLAVEEQYYMLFPLFILFMWRFGRNPLFYSIIVLSVISLLLSEWGWRNHPTANFYLAPTRAWELFAGSICAFMQFGKEHNKNNLLSLFGLALIVYAISQYDSSTPFPSLYTLVPVVGTSLVILYGSTGTWAAQLLSTRIIVGAGLISYSAYLWHLPLLTFYKIGYLETSRDFHLYILILITFPLAYLSWKYVEKPFRIKKERRKGNHDLVRLGIFYSFIAAAASSILVFNIPSYLALRKPAPPKPIVSLEISESVDCVNFATKLKGTKCEVIGNGATNIVIWGDSHAVILRQGIYQQEEFTFTIITNRGCPPLIGVRRYDRVGNYLNCSDKNYLTSNAQYIKNLNPEYLILVGRWTLYMRGWHRKDQIQSATHFITDDTTDKTGAEESTRATGRALKKTVEFFDNIPGIFILSQVPDMQKYGFRKVQIIDDYGAPFREVSSWHQNETQLFATLSDIYPVNIIDTKEYFCNGEICNTRKEGLLLYSDDNHLSHYGSSLLWSHVMSTVRNQASN